LTVVLKPARRASVRGSRARVRRRWRSPKRSVLSTWSGALVELVAPSVAGRLRPMASTDGARERARTEVTADIKNRARRQLAEVGAAKLSLRAVSRELGMASSALYRYFPSRDDLLTALIIDAYDAVGAAAEAALEAAESVGDAPIARWQ